MNTSYRNKTLDYEIHVWLLWCNTTLILKEKMFPWRWEPQECLQTQGRGRVRKLKLLNLAWGSTVPELCQPDFIMGCCTDVPHGDVCGKEAVNGLRGKCWENCKVDASAAASAQEHVCGVRKTPGRSSLLISLGCPCCQRLIKPVSRSGLTEPQALDCKAEDRSMVVAKRKTTLPRLL